MPSGKVTLITFNYIHRNMPIDINRFEQGDEAKLRATGHTNGERILVFLASNPEHAYTPKEIHRETDVPRGSVGVVLSRLEGRGLVRHRGDYWAIADTKDVEKTLTALDTARAATDRFGPEDPDKWGPGVQQEES